MANPRPGSFSAYLEYSQRSSEASSGPVSEPTSLLTMIGREPHSSIRMSELVARSKMSAAMFHDSLQQLADSGFVEISGSPLPDAVKLTDKGREVAGLFK